MNRFQDAVARAVPSRHSPIVKAILAELGDPSLGADDHDQALKFMADAIEDAVLAYYAVADLDPASAHTSEVAGDFYRGYFIYEILSESPVSHSYSLAEAARETNSGAWVGSFGPSFSRRVGASEMAAALAAAGSDPTCFGL